MSLAAAAALLCGDAQAHQLEVEFMATVGRDCRITVSTTEGGTRQEALTRFQADRLDSAGRYIHGIEEGGIEGLTIAGTYVTEEEVVQDADGTFRGPRPGDPEDKIRTLTKTFSLDPRGHCTFFHGVLRAPGSNDVLRHYMWGYPFGTIKEVQATGEPPPRSGEF
jgi:hypothetical protein